MTDPFADLERELLAAHRRDLKPTRHLRAAPRVLAVAGAVAALAWLGGLSVSGDPERAASPQQGDPAPPPGRDPDADPHDQPGVTPVDGCAGVGWVAPQSQEPVPAAITDVLGVFRRPPTSGARPDPHMIGRQSSHVYADGHRPLPPTDRWRMHAVAAEILPRDQVGRQDDPCGEPQGELEPGVCLVIAEDEGAMSACFTLAEITAGDAYIDADGKVIGLAPDGARLARAGDAEYRVTDNLFVLDTPDGPRTEVVFVE